MHIHPNNNLQLAALGVGREQVSELQAKRAAEVRKKLSAASRAMALGEDEFSSTAGRVEARTSDAASEAEPGAGPVAYPVAYSGHRSDAGDRSGQLFSAKA